MRNEWHVHSLCALSSSETKRLSTRTSQAPPDAEAGVIDTIVCLLLRTYCKAYLVLRNASIWQEQEANHKNKPKHLAYEPLRGTPDAGSPLTFLDGGGPELDEDAPK